MCEGLAAQKCFYYPARIIGSVVWQNTWDEAPCAWQVRHDHVLCSEKGQGKPDDWDWLFDWLN